MRRESEGARDASSLWFGVRRHKWVCSVAEVNVYFPGSDLSCNTISVSPTIANLRERRKILHTITDIIQPKTVNYMIYS